MTNDKIVKNGVDLISDTPRAKALIAVGENGIEPGNEKVLNAYFAPNYVFHGPGGVEMNFEQLKAFWDVWRNALTDFKITREQIIVEGLFASARSIFSGKFDNLMTDSPVGQIQPNGKQVNIRVIVTFRYNEDGTLAEEWAEFDNLTMLKAFGVDLLAKN